MVLCAVECIDPIRVRYLLHSSCCCRCSVLANAGVHCRRFPLLYFGRWLIVKYKPARLSAVEAVLSSTDGRRSGAWAISGRYRKSGSATLAQQSHPGAVAGKGRVGLHLTEDEVVVHGTDFPIGRI